MQNICGLEYSPAFNPLVCDYFSGMVVSLPLHTRLLAKKYTADDVRKALAEYYAGANFVKVMPEGAPEDGFLSANDLSGTNMMQLFVNGNDDRLILCSRLDNLGKGASGAAVQCLNIMMGIDETTGLRPGMNANAEIVVAQAKNALTVPNAAIVRGGYVLVRQDSPSAVNADDSMSAPEGYVYVKVKTGVSDDNYTQVTSGLSESDTIAYDPSSVSSDSYYDDGGYDDMGGGELEDAGNAADLTEGGEETLPEETENGEAPTADAEEPAEGIDPAEAGAVVVD